MGFLASGWQLWHSLPELTRIRESSFLHVTLLLPRKKKNKVQTFAQGNSKRPVQAVMIWELGKKGLCKYWYHELQHSLLAALGSDRLHSPPAHLPCRFSSLGALPTPQNCYQMWENLEGVKSCGLKQLARRRRFESEHVKPERRGTSSCTDRMNSASPGVPWTQSQPRWRQWDKQWLWQSEMGEQQHRHSCSLASFWGSIACTYCSCMCPHWCRLDKSWLSCSSEAHIQEKREAGREVIWPKTHLEIPRVLLESSARARFLPTKLSKFLSATINAMFSLLRIMHCSIRQKIFLLLGPSSKMGLSLPSTIFLFQQKHVSVLWAHPSSL